MNLSKVEFTELKKIVNSKFYSPINILNVIDYENVYDIKNSQIHITPLYRVAYAKPGAGSDEFTVIDKNFTLNQGFNEIAFKKYPSFKKLKRADVWNDKIKGTVCTITGKVNLKKFFIELKKSKHWTWRKFIDFLVDKTGEMGERMKCVFKSAYLPLPLEEYSLWQGLNNHIVVVSNSRIGKTSGMINLTGQVPAKKSTEPGLFGSYIDGGIMSKGKLTGNGMYAFDEFPRKNNKMSKYEDNDIMSDLFTYQNNGETIRDIQKGIKCIGCKTLLYFGNVPNEWNIDSLHKIITKLCGNEGADAAGTRTGIFLYGDNFKRINGTDTLPIDIGNRMRYALESICQEKKSIIKKTLHYFKKYVEEEDKEFTEFFVTLSKMAKYSNVQMFLKGYSGSWNRLKLGAIKLTILEHLDLFYTKYKFKEIMNILKKDIYLNYEKLKTYCYRSFDFIKNTQKGRAYALIKQGYNYKELTLAGVNISLPTYNEWKYKFTTEQEENVIK